MRVNSMNTAGSQRFVQPQLVMGTSDLSEIDEPMELIGRVNFLT